MKLPPRKKSNNVGTTIRNGKDVLSNGKKQAGYLNFRSTWWSPNRTYIFAPLYDDAKKELDSSSRYRMLAVSRDLENNFAVYKQLIDTVSRFSVGRGIRPSPTTSNDKFNILADFTWNQWANNRFCTVDESGTFVQTLRLVAERLVADGEVFTLLTKSASDYPQLQLIDPLKVANDSEDGDIKVVDGIAYNPSGKPLSYSIKTDKGFVRIVPENVIHVFDKKRIGQGRGYPWAQSAFSTMTDVQDTYNLELQGIKASAVFAGQLLDRGQGGPDDGGIIGPRNKQPQPTVDGTAIPTNENPAEVERVTLGGKVLNLNNKEFKLIESNRPSPQFESLRKMLHRDICQAMGIPVEIAYDPEDLNNSSSNTVVESGRAFFSEVQHILIESFCKRVYAWVLSIQLPLSEVRPLGNESPFEAHWIPPRKFGISRQDMANAIDAVNNKMSTLKRFYAENYGEDWKPNIVERISEEAFIQAEADRQGVDMKNVIYGKGTLSVKATEDDPDTEGKGNTK